MSRQILRSDIDQMEKRYRANLINSLTGFKAINLIGTVNAQGQTNLAIFNSTVHLGANPPLMGFIQRPVSVRRDTHANILQTKHFTINHLHKGIMEQAHQSAARYDADVSEFEATGLTPYFSDTLPAPYVAESHIRIGLQFRQAIPIPLNNTILMIGEIIEILLPETLLSKDGYLDLEAAGSLTGSGLDGYHQPQKLERLSYAKPDQSISRIPFLQ
ncbi:MAG: flavin reductase [Bacteroidota bacterium]